jgi:TetR/AcrR family transcriptional regulator, cholesterol catabolism regulator
MLAAVSRPVNKGERRRESLIAGAAGLFDMAGYHQVNMTAVAESVGIAKPTLYHYFSGKDDILFGIHEEFIDLLLGRYEGRRGEVMSATDELRALMHDTFELMETHRGYLRVFFENYRELSSEAQVTIRAKRDRYQQIVEGTIARGVRSGEFKPVDVRLTSLAVFGMCNWAYQWFAPDGELSSAEIADAFFELLLHGLGTQ